MKKFLAAAITAIMLCVALTGCSGCRGCHGWEITYDAPDKEALNEELYKKAKSLLSEGYLYGAYEIFLTIPDFRDVPEYLNGFIFLLEKSEGFSSDGGEYSNSYEYDDCGRRIFLRYNNIDSGYESVKSYKYDSRGLLTKCSEEGTFKYDELGRPILKSGDFDVELEYDERGNITKVISEYGYTEERKYDENNYRTEKVTYYYGYGDKKTLYEYNEHGDIVKITEYDVNGTPTVTRDSEYEYDEHGNKILYIDKVDKASGIGIQRSEWEYDAKGNVIKKINYYSYDTDYQINYFTYNEKGLLIEQRCEDENGKTLYYFSYEYDKYGNKVSSSFTDVLTETEYKTSYRYTYRIFYSPNLDRVSAVDPLAKIPPEMMKAKG